MPLTRDSSVESTLPCSGSRCWTTTKAMPQVGGIAGMKAWSASMPPADAPMPTTGIAGLLRSVLTSAPPALGFIPVIGQRTPFRRQGRCFGRVPMALDHPPDHLGIFLVLACPALQLTGQVLPVPATLLFRHAMREGGPLLMGPQKPFQHVVDFAVQCGKDGLCRESMADMAAVAKHTAVGNLPQGTVAFGTGEG